MAKQRNDGDGSVYPVHTKNCTRPSDARGNAKCSCRWRGAVITGYRRTASGNTVPVRKTVTAATKQGCAVKVRELREAIAAKTLPVGKSPTLEQWLNHCHSTLLPRQKKPPRETSLIRYRSVFDNYLIPTMGHLRISAITADDIESTWTLLAEHGNPTKGDKAEPLSPNTIHYAHTILSRMLRLAVQKKHLAMNPAGPDSMDAPSKINAEIEPLETDEWKRVLATAEGKHNAARWTVALALGLRQGEALGLRWEDVDLDDATLRVRQIVVRIPGKGLVFHPPKTERSKRDIALPSTLVGQLRAHRKKQAEARLLAGDQWHDSGLVFANQFGKTIDPSSDNKAWRQLLEEAGVRRVKLHAARHTAATMMLLQNIDPRVVMDIMGWSQITTASRYRHAISEAKVRAANQIEAAFS